MTSTDARFADRASLEAFQLERLRESLAAILPANTFYAQKFRGLNWNSEGPASLADFFAQAPFTLKQELVQDQIENPPYGTNLTFPLERYTRFNQTSGTSGVPLRWLDTNESWSWMLDNWSRVFAAAGVTRSDRLYFAFSFGPFLGFWTAFESATRLGCLCIPGGGLRSSARLEAILSNAATVLCCTPTYAIRLAEVAGEENIDLAQSKVTKIIVAGEPGGSIPSTRALIQDLWRGAAVIDHHGMTEVGPVSYECPARRSSAAGAGILHIIGASYLCEVIDPQTGQPVAAGELGELVLTNLGRTGSPLLRYRTGDIVQLGSAGRCECGVFDPALEGGVLGRTDDMVVVRGVNVYPSAIEDILRGCEGVAEYRVEIRTERALPEMDIQVEPLAGQDPIRLQQRLEAAFGNALALRVAITTVANGKLPRFEMKAKRWVRV